MSIKPDRYTIKSQEALQAAQQLAAERQNPELLPEHLLCALVKQSDGIVAPILQRGGMQASVVEDRLRAELDRLPKVSGAQTYASQRLAQLLEAAWKEAQSLTDEYLSTEHLLLALAQEKDGAASSILREGGLTRDMILALLKTLRGSQRVTDPEPEGSRLAAARRPA